MSRQLAVLVVDDSDALRALVSSYIDSEADLQVIASVSSGHAAVRHVQGHCPDVILLDHQMADGTGLEVLPELRDRCPEARIVMFSASTEVRDRALATGADEFVDKDQPLDLLADRLRVGA